MIDLHKYDRIWLDTETTGLYYPRDRAFMASMAFPDGTDIVIDSRLDSESWQSFARQIQRFRGQLVAHNMSFDCKMLTAAGIKIPMDNLDDTVIRAVCIDENHGVIYPWTRKPSNYSLDWLGEHYLGERKDTKFLDEAREFFGRAKASKQWIMERIQELPPELVARYAAQDAVLLRSLWLWQEGEIEKQGIRDICEFERSVMPTLIRAEMRGIRVDEDRAQQAIVEVHKEVDVIKSRIKDLAGFELNVNSSPQIREAFQPKEDENGNWFAIDGTPLPKTPAGKPSFNAEVLREMKHPLAAEIVDLRSTIRTADTFLEKHVLGHAYDGHVYPSINQTASEEGGTRTGRLSYVDPAMQQIPSRNKKVASIVKPVFLAPEGMKWVDGDMQSFEVRVFAHLVSAYNDMIAQVYAANPMTDFHQWVADLTGLVRNAEYSGQANAKQLNLSMIFNSGKGAIADKMGLPWTWAEFEKGDQKIRYKKAGPEAEAVIETYHNRIGGVRELAKKAKSVAEKRGYIKTYRGRRLRFRNQYKSYSASGLLIQATAADVNKENWVLTEEALGDDGWLMLNTHDSYSMAIQEDWRPAYDRVKQALERPVLRVPLIFELSGVGNNWWEALQGV